LGGDYGGVAVGFWVSVGVASARGGDALCVAVARRGVPVSARREVAGVPESGRGEYVGGADGGVAAGECVCGDFAGGDDDGCGDACWGVFRDEYGEDFCVSR